MKRLLAFAACAVLVACSSSNPAPDAASDAGASQAKVVEPEISFVQLVGPEELNWPVGELELKYALRVENRDASPITLRQIQIETVGQQGPYYLPRGSYFFNTAVAPAATRDLEFWAKGFSEGNRYKIDAQSPITVRGIAFFNSPNGNFRKVFITNLAQPAKR
jgi:hypothetical protein